MERQETRTYCKVSRNDFCSEYDAINVSVLCLAQSRLSVVPQSVHQYYILHTLTRLNAICMLELRVRKTLTQLDTYVPIFCSDSTSTIKYLPADMW